MSVRLGISGTALMLLLVLSLSPPPASARAVHGWIDDCAWSHSIRMDPDGQGRSIKLHDVFGARDLRPASTVASMRAGGTTCPAADTAGYWAPALFKNGHRVLPKGSGIRNQVYYRDDNLRARTTVRAFPPGMEITAGNPHAATASGNPELGSEVYWGCSNDTPGGTKHTHPISCRTGIISLHVGFPNCWDGVHVSMTKTPNAVVYPHDGRCPSTHAVALPRVIERWEYPVGTRSRHIRLSTGPTFTAYGGFWNTWKQRALRRLVTTCLNGNRNCGVFGR